MNIEVESKFSVPATFKQDLVAVGAHLVNQTTLLDIYFDRPGFELLKQDLWLRQRYWRYLNTALFDQEGGYIQ